MNRISHSKTITLNAVPDDVFPLFTAIGEHYWVEGWNPIYVYPESGEAAVGTIFKTQHTSSTLQSHNPPESIWVTVEYDPERHVAIYISVTPEVAVVRVDIQCQLSKHNQTRATVTYTLTALGELGRASIAGMTTDRYQSMMADWERAINYYVAHGEPIFA